MVGTLADAVAASLRSGTEALEHRRAVHEDRLHIKVAGLCLALGFLLPVGNCGAEKLLNLSGSFLVGEFEDAQGLE